MRGLVVLAFDPRPQTAVERLDAVERAGVEVGEPAFAEGPEPSLDLSLGRWLEGLGVDQRDAELGADEGEVPGPVAGAVVDVEAVRQSAAHEGLPEHGQEGGGVLGEREGGVGDDAGGVVDEGDQIGLAAPAAVGDGRAVHDVAHPQLAGVPVGEAAAVGGGPARVAVEEPLAGEQPVDRRGREMDVVRHALPPRLVDHGAHGEGGAGGLYGDQQFGGLRGQPAGTAAVGARPGMQGVEAAAPVEAHPVAEGLGGDPGAVRAGDVVDASGLVAQPGADARGAGRQVDEVGDQAVSEQRHGLPEVVVGGLRHVAGLVRRRGGRCGER